MPVLVPADRFARRMSLMHSLELAGFARDGGGDRVKDHNALYRQTAGMVLSPRMKAFDLEAEDSATRDAYGRTAFGQGCLLARRLVDAGVTFVEVRLNGWDTHDNNNERVGTLAGQVDNPGQGQGQGQGQSQGQGQGKNPTTTTTLG